VRLAFAGTPEAALPSLRALLDSPRHDVVAVLTRPPARAGRGRKTISTPVADAARAAGVSVLAPERPGDPDVLARLSDLGVQCCPVVGYGALIPPAALGVPPHGWVNLHFSLLPA
jgi:methionyl-tRNA formyltransferase